MKKKFTIIDYLIIILVIGAVVFAFIHITSDDSSDVQKTAFDSSTASKIYETFANYYKDGYIVKSTIAGFNSTNGEKINLNGTIKWVDDGSIPRIILESEGQSYFLGYYKNVKDADIYLDTISLESDGSKYSNLVEITANPKNVTSMNDLKANVSNGEYEVSTKISTEDIDSAKIQQIENIIMSHDKRISVKTNEKSDVIIITQSTDQDLSDANSVLGSIDGISDQIKIRIYNCTDDDINNVKNNFDVINVRNF